MITEKEIQTNLIKAIKESKITQTNIAKYLNITQSSIAHYIKCDIMPALDTFANICVLLDLDANEILGIDKEQKKNNYIINSQIGNGNNNKIKF